MCLCLGTKTIEVGSNPLWDSLITQIIIQQPVNVSKPSSQSPGPYLSPATQPPCNTLSSTIPALSLCSSLTRLYCLSLGLSPSLFSPAPLALATFSLLLFLSVFSRIYSKNLNHTMEGITLAVSLLQPLAYNRLT